LTRPRLALLAALLTLCLPAAASAGEDPSLGRSKAKVWVEEYASLSCVHCAHFNNEVFPAFKARYIDTGKVRYTLHEILTSPTEFAAAGFLTARCAPPAKYYAVIDAIFRGREAMFSGDDVRGGLLTAAKSAGVTAAQFDACLNDPAALEALNARVAKNAVDGEIHATPTFVVNGVKVKEGVMSLEELDAAVADAAKAKPKRP